MHPVSCWREAKRRRDTTTRDIGHSFEEQAERTSTATRSRMVQLAHRRAGLAEQAHQVAEEAAAYALFRLRNRADDPKGVELAMKAHRDALAGYRDLLSVDPQPNTAMDDGIAQVMELRRFAIRYTQADIEAGLDRPVDRPGELTSDAERDPEGFEDEG